jgi:DNA-directed RNA polymerase subunit M/transcription elongation factor TFIIS
MNTLPKLETPTYSTTLPSTGEKVDYRPFLVKEEKVLMIAQESNNNSAMLKALKSIIKACTFEKINPSKCTTYDIEYMFLKLRAASVGETAEIQFKCEECGEYNTVEINLNDIEVVYPEKKPETDIKLTDNVGIKLKEVSVDEVETLSDVTNAENFTKAIAAVIDVIYDADNVYKVSETSPKEVDEFIDNLSHTHLEKIQEFIENQPMLKHTVKFKCSKCGHDNEIELVGLQSFFI